MSRQICQIYLNVHTLVSSTLGVHHPALWSNVWGVAVCEFLKSTRVWVSERRGFERTGLGVGREAFVQHRRGCMQRCARKSGWGLGFGKGRSWTTHAFSESAFLVNNSARRPLGPLILYQRRQQVAKYWPEVKMIIVNNKNNNTKRSSAAKLKWPNSLMGESGGEPHRCKFYILNDSVWHCPRSAVKPDGLRPLPSAAEF